MAVKKKSKRPARKGTKRARKPAKRTARKRTARPVRKRGARKATARKSATRKSVAQMSVTHHESLDMGGKVIDLTAAPRCRSRIPVEVEFAGRVERAAIVDMSSSGARLEGPRLELEPGTPLQIRYPSTSVAMDAEFVRVTENGFAAKILRR
jgi:hypothetical protein